MARAFVYLAAIAAVSLVGSAYSAPPDCRIGSYRLTDGSDVDVGPADGNALRWRRKDGTTGKLTAGARDRWTSTIGWTGRADGKTVAFDCDRGTVDFAGLTGTR